MTDISVTAASVVSGTGAQTKAVTAGATIAAGKTVVRDPATGKWVLADTNHATVALRTPGGIAINSASDGQPLSVLTAGPVSLGTVLTAGTDYWSSDTAGGICPRADVGSGERAVQLGTASTTSVLNVVIQDTGVTI